MPEAPDVEIFIKYFNEHALNQKIKSVDVKTTKVLDGISSSQLKKWLKNRKFVSATRYGKYLLAKTDDDKILVMHFGMSGDLEYFGDSQGNSKHTRVLFNFENDKHLAYISQRMLGHVGETDSLENLKKEKNLGPDVKELKYEEFRDDIQKQRGFVKSFLMNQKHIAGIGNIYSDEILFQTGIHPKKNCNELKENDIKTLYKKLQEVMKVAIENEAHPERMPDSYMLPHRGTDMQCPNGDGKMETIKISGRTAYFCPKIQK